MIQRREKHSRSYFDGCQIHGVPEFATGAAPVKYSTFMGFIKSSLAYPWNQYVKKWFKRVYYTFTGVSGLTKAQKIARAFVPVSKFKDGATVKVRSREEIHSTLDPFNELKGCSFLPQMYQYCGTEQRVFRVMNHFMDERDYRMKKTRGIVLLENIFCNGTAVFGNCDRCCFLFWREEWLEKVEMIKDPAEKTSLHATY